MKETKTWYFNENHFQLEVADTAAERQQGLMFRESLSENEGMLFIFEQTGVHPFWMKNTLIPLDMIWLDENLTVVALLSADPCEKDSCTSYDPKREARYVIELNRGTTALLNLSEGDRWYWPRER